MYYDISELFLGSFETVWSKVVEVIPMIVLAAVVLVVGWMIATIVCQSIQRVINSVSGINNSVDSVLGDSFRRAGLRVDVGRAVGVVFYVFIIVLALVIAFDILHLTALTEFFERILAYIPNVVVAGLIIVFGAIIAKWLSSFVMATVKAGKLGDGKIVSRFVHLVVIVFVVLAALTELGVTSVGSLVQPILQSVFTAASIAAGIAFGFGGQDHARDALDRWTGRK